MSDFDNFSEIDPKAVARRVKQLREKLNITQIDLARRSYSSQQTICNLERGAVKVPRNIPAIAAVLGVKPRFLLTGISELGVPVVTPDKITSTLEMMKSGIDLQDDMQFVTPTKTSKTDSYPNSIAMLVNDAAMSIAGKGDIVILDTASDAGPGMLVAVNHNGIYTLRKARVKEGGAYSFVSDNEDYPTITDTSIKTFVVTEIRKLLM